ncbi:peptidyl-tRNA hydrolase II [Lentinus tigrinus ALCF2SS1-6]|uniref:peptidyl-tRNA hydrolase n=1 Tax=Lentinus tigrinus ALCF2SS1-6 TaxID=1328759 RepID=A0A5C2SIS0_9APHY|nr:peptidyl-tRNA hydrolase II [Lentinus tigrinus ALCF2SS1-6]
MSSLSTAQSVVFAVSLLASLSAGYALGAWSSHVKSPESKAPAADTPDASTEAQDDSESDEEEVADGDLSAVKPGLFENCKLALVVRTDLEMSTGKIAAQHATLACYKALQHTNPGLLRHWERTGQAKIALKVKSEEELLELEAIAKSLNLAARSICDAGRTQVAAGSRTVLGVGPGPIELVNKVTGKLRLL